MIEALIGLALGVGGMWLWMRGRVKGAHHAANQWKEVAKANVAARDAANEEAARLYTAYDKALTELDSEMFACANERRLHAEAEAAHSRCSDSQSILHDKVQQVRTLCSKRKDSTAIAVMKMIGDGK